MISCTCSSNSNYAKKTTKQKNNKIFLKIRNYPKFEQRVLNNVERPHKNGAKRQKFNSPSALL
jgi:hypothetical protein